MRLSRVSWQITHYLKKDTNKQMKSVWDLEKTIRGKIKNKKLPKKISNIGKEKFIKKTKLETKQSVTQIKIL